MCHLLPISHSLFSSPTPGRAALGLHSPSPRVCTRGWAYADVITKISRIDRLPNFLTHGAPLARFARRSSAIKLYLITKNCSLLLIIFHYWIFIFASVPSVCSCTTDFAFSLQLAPFSSRLFTEIKPLPSVPDNYIVHSGFNTVDKLTM